MNDMLIKLNGVLPSEEVCKKVAAECGNKVMLAFSCGKDSIACWIQLKRLGIQVVPYYCYIVPGLEFIEEQIRYYEDFFQTPIIRAPSEAFYRQMVNMTFQPPHHAIVIMDSSLRKWKDGEFHEAMLTANGMPDGLIGSGVRACDSARRRLNFIRTGPINRRRRTFYPVWDWTIDKIRVELYKSKVRVPKDYWIFGRSFDGLDYRFLEPVSRYYPADYQRILEYFPLAEVELYRRRSVAEQNQPTTAPQSKTA